MAGSSLPVANPTISFWGAAAHRLADYRSTSELPPQVDIAVIGAGYAGVSTVHHILNSCKSQGTSPPRIAIFEARQACSGATARNGGHLKPDIYSGPANLAVSHGVDAAAEVASFEVRNLAAVKRTIEDNKIDCDFVYTRAVDVFMTDETAAQAKSKIDLLRNNANLTIADLYFVEGPDSERLSGVKGAKACATFSAGHLFPRKLILDLLTRTLDAGVNLQTHTPVTGVSKTTDTDGYVTITTPRGQMRARNVIFATNGYTNALLPEFADKIIAARGICSHIRPARAVAAPALRTSYMIRWSDTNYEYLIPRLDGSIVVGGARSEFFHDLPSWYNNANDDALIESARHYFDGFMQRVFHGWEDSGAKVDRIWTGIMGYTSDSLPFVGKIPGRKNQYILAGFNGHGMPQVFLAAKGIAAMVVDKAGFGDVDIPAIFEITQARLDSTGNNVLENWRKAQKTFEARRARL
ncbi:FAD dependent oxidoreductase [Microdochium trichocladiopsis]|uniref:FAD dependent oxidoreductase n=1 Tax=Microdochium trichocladiopsis TaxID=1682393 RepID=A0A9P8XWS7_9PEZI|nr:FAD dependent oxidoreductase [Microdochium trichocladiopsis]KAH7020807.1 FAD dependent oxidoreductase [Microdochium trichocladiopsis]